MKYYAMPLKIFITILMFFIIIFACNIEINIDFGTGLSIVSLILSIVSLRLAYRN